jgi:hypothetical protein
MAEMPRYRKIGVGVSQMPTVSTVGLQQASRTSQSLAQAMDRIAGFAFKQAAQQAEIEGREYGALNAPTPQQIKDAMARGEDVEQLVPGDKSTIFGRAARQYGLDKITTQMEMQGRKSVTEYQAAYESGDISLDQLELGLETVVSQHSTLLKQISPIAAQKYSATMGVVSNSAFLAAAKQEAARNRADQEILSRNSMDTIIGQTETIIRGGDTLDAESGTLITVQDKLRILEQGLVAAAQDIDDPEFYQTKYKEFQEAIKQAKINIVMDVAKQNPGQALLKVRKGKGFNDPEAQKVYAEMTNEEKRELEKSIEAAYRDELSLESAEETRKERQRKEDAGKISAEITSLMLDGDRAGANAKLEELRKVDPDTYETKAKVLATEPGINDPSAIVTLRRLSLINKLTEADIDNVYTEGKMDNATYKEFMSDLENQRNQKYNKAVDFLRSNRGLPDRTIINFSATQRRADQEVAAIKSDLIEAIDSGDQLALDNPLQWIKSAIKDLEEAGGDAANVAKREAAQTTLAELRALTKNPEMDAAAAIRYLQDDNRKWFTNEALTAAALANLEVLRQIQESQ